MRLKIPGRMTWDQVRKLFLKIEHAQANVRLLTVEVDKLRPSASAELESWEALTKAVNGGSAPEEQIRLAVDLQRSISVLLRQLNRFESQIPRRRDALEKLGDLTRQNLALLRAFKKLPRPRGN